MSMSAGSVPPPGAPVIDLENRLTGGEVHGDVLAGLGLPLPAVFENCDLRDTVWPKDLDLSGLEFIDCDLSGSNWDGALGADIRIIATEKGRSKVHGMSMRRADLPGLTMVRVVGIRVDLSEALVDDANVRYSSLVRLQATLLHGENAHFCTGTVMDESNWDRAICPGICFCDASMIKSSLRNAVFC